MARYTSVYRDFVTRLDEVSLLRKRARALERSRHSLRNGNEINALCRASIVLLSGHIEAYIKELGEHTLDSLHTKAVCRSKLAPQFFYYLSKERIENIRSSSRPERIAGHVKFLFRQDAQKWGDAGAFTEPVSSQEFNSGFSTPSYDKIKSYFGRFGYNTLERELSRKLLERTNIITNGLDQIVSTRNLIAHGDPSATKTPGEVKDMEDVAKAFCRTVDLVFSDWCGQHLCAIR